MKTVIILTVVITALPVFEAKKDKRQTFSMNFGAPVGFGAPPTFTLESMATQHLATNSVTPLVKTTITAPASSLSIGPPPLSAPQHSMAHHQHFAPFYNSQPYGGHGFGAHALAYSSPAYTSSGYTSPGYTSPAYTSPSYNPYASHAYASPAYAAPAYTPVHSAYMNPSYASPFSLPALNFGGMNHLGMGSFGPMMGLGGLGFGGYAPFG